MGKYSTKQGRRAISYMKQHGVTNPNKQKQIIDGIMNDLEIHHTNNPRFNYLVGCVRLYLDMQLTNVEDINSLKTVLKYVSDEGHQGQYDENLNNLSLAELSIRFTSLRQTDSEQSRNNVNQLGYGEQSANGYEIVKIESKEQCKQYGGYTSWCITHGSYSGYQLDSTNQCYFCLKPDFKNISEPQDKSNAPFDEFGLSMVSVIVDYNGEPLYITTRYNHNFNGENNPKLCTAEQVSRLIGVNFYKVFQPNEKGLEMQRRFREAQTNLDNGMSPEEVFDRAYPFNNGFAQVRLNGKWNFINIGCRILSDTWFDLTDNFKDDFAQVVLNLKWNLINTKGRLLSDTWFNFVGDFVDGFAMVRLNRNFNYINTECRLLSDTWFDYVDNFSNGFAAVQLNGKWNFIDTEGRIISDIWFDLVGDFRDGFGRAQLNGETNYIDPEGKLYDENLHPIQMNDE